MLKDYYVNKQAQANGDHEVHIRTCRYLPDVENSIYLGYFESCKGAIIEARVHYNDVDGCYYCCRECHTE